MMRAAVITLFVRACGGTCQGEKCSATQDTSLIQKIQISGADDGEDGGWTFQNSFVNGLMDKLSPDAVTEKVDKIITDNSISLDAAQNKLYGLAHKFGSRLNKTITAAQDRLTDLQDYINVKGHQIKDQSLIQAVATITALGDAAIDVAEKVTAEVDQGQSKVKEMIMLVQSEKVESRQREMQRSLNAAVMTLTGLVHALEDTMDDSEDSPMDLPTGLPDVTQAAIDKAEQLLVRTGKILDRSKVYVEFVKERIAEARDEATALAEQAGNQTDAAFDASNKLADDLVAKLGQINRMLDGNITFLEAKEAVDAKKSSASAVSVSLMALCVAAASFV